MSYTQKTMSMFASSPPAPSSSSSSPSSSESSRSESIFSSPGKMPCSFGTYGTAGTVGGAGAEVVAAAGLCEEEAVEEDCMQAKAKETGRQEMERSVSQSRAKYGRRERGGGRGERWARRCGGGRDGGRSEAEAHIRVVPFLLLLLAVPSPQPHRSVRSSVRSSPESSVPLLVASVWLLLSVRRGGVRSCSSVGRSRPSLLLAVLLVLELLLVSVLSRAWYGDVHRVVGLQLLDGGRLKLGDMRGKQLRLPFLNNHTSARGRDRDGTSTSDRAIRSGSDHLA